MGAHTVGLARAAGDRGYVHAFEPQSEMFQALAANIALNGLLNTRTWNLAVDRQPGVLHVPQLDYSMNNNFGGNGRGVRSNPFRLFCLMNTVR